MAASHTRPIEFRQPRLILCEGVEDAQFLRQLRDAGRIKICEVRYVKDLGGTPGISGFHTALERAAPLSSFPILQHIILVADQDEGGGHTFAKIKKQIERANRAENVNGAYPVPSQAGRRKGGRPSLAVFLIPPRKQKGALETLLWDDFSARHPKQARCAMTACSEAGILKASARWNQAQRDKAHLRIGLALACKKDPMISLSLLWERHRNVIPIDSDVFADTASRIDHLW